MIKIAAGILFTFLICESNTYAMSLRVNETKRIKTDFNISLISLGAPSVASYKISDSDEVFIFGKSPGETNIIITGEGGEIKNIPLEIQAGNKNDYEKINTLIKNYGYKDLVVINMGRMISVSGMVDTQEDIDSIKEIIEESGVDTDKIKYSLNTKLNKQIKIRVTVAEVSKNISEKLGIDWGQGGGGLGIAAGAYSGLIKGFNFDSLGVAINALEKRSLAKVLSTPSITVINGSTASFHGGGQIPLYQQNAQTSSVTWKDYGVKLNFSPVINNDLSINMKVNIESSQIAEFIHYGTTELPLLNTRSVETSVRMKNGESFILGGLIDSNQYEFIDKIPGLSTIPIFGELFKSRNYKMGRSELLIFASIEFVEPDRKNEYINLPKVYFTNPWSNYYRIVDGDSKLAQKLIMESDYLIY